MKMYWREVPQRVLPNHYPSSNEAVKEVAPERWYPKHRSSSCSLQCSVPCPCCLGERLGPRLPAGPSARPRGRVTVPH